MTRIKTLTFIMFLFHFGIEARAGHQCDVTLSRQVFVKVIKNFEEPFTKNQFCSEIIIDNVFSY